MLQLSSATAASGCWAGYERAQAEVEGNNEAKISLDAKLEKNTISVEWEIDGENVISPQLFLPYEVETLPSELIQLTSSLYQLPTASGSIKIKLKK